MQKYFFSLSFILAIFSSIEAQESDLDQFESHYASILAQNHRYALERWDLKGAIFSMKVSVYYPGTEANPYSRMLYKFNQEGYLNFWMQGDSSASRNYYQYKIFSFGKDGQIQKITHYDHSQIPYTLIRVFDKSGYLSTISYHTPKDPSLNYQTQIQYNDQQTKMQIKYQYQTAPASWERRVTENYQFTFDPSGFLIQEDLQSRYSYRKTFKRHHKTGGIENSHHQDACFPSNSCVNLIQQFSYDNAGNLIKLNSKDLTVRNSTWTLGENFEASYNAQDLLIEKRIFNASPSVSIFPNTKPNAPITVLRYEYRFDEQGNWIERKEYQGEKLSKITERDIRYY